MLGENWRLRKLIENKNKDFAIKNLVDKKFPKEARHMYINNVPRTSDMTDRRFIRSKPGTFCSISHIHV